jgi:hypothetical protein
MGLSLMQNDALLRLPWKYSGLPEVPRALHTFREVQRRDGTALQNANATAHEGCDRER